MGDCNTINMRVGILRPNWLQGADYKGEDEVNGRKAFVWAQNSSLHHPFATYYEDAETSDPLRWVFFDGGKFDVVKWIPSEILVESEWQLPAYCFDKDHVASS